MRVVKKKHIQNAYKVTCKDIKLIIEGKYNKKLGSRIVKARDIILTLNQRLYLLNLKCKGKAVIGYLIKNKHKFYFIDLHEFQDEFISLEILFTKTK